MHSKSLTKTQKRNRNQICAVCTAEQQVANLGRGNMGMWKIEVEVKRGKVLDRVLQTKLC